MLLIHKFGSGIDIEKYDENRFFKDIYFRCIFMTDGSCESQFIEKYHGNIWDIKKKKHNLSHHPFHQFNIIVFIGNQELNSNLHSQFKGSICCYKKRRNM